MKKLLFAIIIMSILLVVLLGTYFLTNLKKPQQPIPQNNTITIAPPTGTILNSGDILKFKVVYKIKPEVLPTFSLTKRLPGRDEVKVATTTTLNQNTIQISTNETAEAGTFYRLKATLSTGEILFESDYSSPQITPTPIPANNPSLQQYLPHEEENFLLNYSSTKNIYIMHFKFQSSQPGTIDEQFEKTKQDTQEFIRSKNIDPESITIQYSFK